MAKKGSVPGGVDRFINRARGYFTMGAASNTFASDIIHTGLSISDQLKWIIVYCFVQLYSRAQYTDETAGADFCMETQLALGEQTAMLAQDDERVVSTGLWTTSIASAVGFQSEMTRRNVLPIMSPIPIFAKDLTIGQQGSADVASMQAKVWYYEIGYIVAGTTAQDLIETVAATGRV